MLRLAAWCVCLWIAARLSGLIADMIAERNPVHFTFSGIAIIAEVGFVVVLIWWVVSLCGWLLSNV